MIEDKRERVVGTSGFAHRPPGFPTKRLTQPQRVFETGPRGKHLPGEHVVYTWPARNGPAGSFLLVHALDQISHTVRELDHLSLSLDVEID